MLFGDVGRSSTTTQPPLPTVYRVTPQPGCIRVRGTDGRTYLLPPSPGLTARALSPRRIRLDWWFRKLPSACRPTTLVLAVAAYSDERSVPWVVRFPLRTLAGHRVLTYRYYDPPDVALASAYMANGQRSRVVKVLIRR